MAQVRAKFNVTEITKYGNAGGGKVTLNAVVGGDNPENKEFWKATPSGKIEIWIDNPEAMAKFDFGEYYIDFTKVE
jgi:hypothetical protein